MSEAPLKLDVMFEEEAPETVLSLLEEVQAKEIKKLKSKGLTGVEIVVVAVLVANALANLVLRLLPLWKCGVVVDARGARVLTRKDCKLSQGTLLIFSRDGTKTTLVKPQQSDLQPIIDQLLAGKK